MNSVDVSPSDGFSQIYNTMNNSLSKTNPLVLVALSMIIIVYFIIFSYLGYNVTYTTQQSPGIQFIEVVMWGLIIFLVLINGIQYFFNIDVQTAVKNLFLGKPEVDIKISSENTLTVDEKEIEQVENEIEETKEEIEKIKDEINDANMSGDDETVIKLEEKLEKTEKKLEIKKEKKIKLINRKNNTIGKELEKDLGLGNFKVDSKQVFNIPSNEYTYNEAKAICKAYNSELASYNQIENAYKSGAEWCNYGWSKDQLALYPTQKATWNKLQKIKGHEQDCGRPGINGGFIKNKNVRFGVNCYGKKPKITDEEQRIMNTATPYPLTNEDIKMNNLVKKYKKDLSTILVSPFNYDNWNKV